MSKAALRTETDCLNCGAEVLGRYCSQCGQENTHSRKSFHVLFLHFFEDLTHYENAFWKTIRNLLFKPASLTQSYLSGKRMSYLAPVRLYIFVSFVAFFSFSFFSNVSENTTLSTPKKAPVTKHKNDIFLTDQYNNISSLDSIYKSGKGAGGMSKLEYLLHRKKIQINDTYTDDEFAEKFQESFIHNLPKVLILYMPIFAFVLWLFHDKKKWYYFEHGIFTLHYFSFLLLIQMVVFYINLLLDLAHLEWVDTISTIITVLATIWMLYYFFPAHHRMFGVSRKRSVFYGIIIGSINGILLSAITISYLVYVLLNIN
ncbi:MAG: hypothetical protein CFE24_05480 [Flavobacterium sp. BFFFF2]|nr:MAG: hypothetical protein CFE24_05480 [Flavobacterium sp. BFFFF2]